MAVPCSLFIPVSRSMIPSAVSLSRFPVGSSANITSGLFRSALAMAILCCSPPDNWCGILCDLWTMPTASRTSEIRLSMSELFFHPVALSTKSRFSSTLLSMSSWKSWNTTPRRRLRKGMSFSRICPRSNPQTSPLPFTSGFSAMTVLMMEVLPVPTLPTI